MAADETEQGGKQREKTLGCIFGFGDGSDVLGFLRSLWGGMDMPELRENKHHEFLHVLRDKA